MRTQFRRLAAGLGALALTLGLCACGQPGNHSGSAGGHYDDSLLGEVLTQEGEYTDSLGNDYRYSLHVPELRDESAEAQAVNDEIWDIFGGAAEDAIACMESGDSLTVLSVSWTSHWQGSLLSLLVQAEMDADYTVYAAWNYDFQAQERVGNGALLERLDIQPEDYLEALRRSAARFFDGNYQSTAADIAAMAELRAKTLSRDNLTEDLPLYLAQDGRLTAIVPVASPAGAEWYERPLDLDLDLDPATPAQPLSAAFGFVTAELAAGELSVTVQDTPEARAFFANADIRYGTPCPVEGLYGRYTALFCGSLGLDFHPYLLLRTEEGTVECVNVVEGLLGGTLCASGPLPGVSGVKGFETGSAEGETGVPTLYANTESGRIDLSDAICAAERQSLSGLWDGNWSSEAVSHENPGGGSYESLYNLVFGSDGTLQLQVSDPQAPRDAVNRFGSYTCLGVTGEGIEVSYQLYDEADGVQQGVLALSPDWDSLKVRVLSGLELFGTARSAHVNFTRSYG